MKKKIAFLSVVLSFVIVLASTFNVAIADEKIYLGGMPAGFTLTTRGVEVVGMCDVVGEKSVYSPAKDCGIEVGDVILNIDNEEINNVVDIENCVKNKKEVVLTIKRGEETMLKTIKPAKDISGSEKLGIFIKNGVSGIGTITFIKGNRFASLGHPIISEQGDIVEIKGGYIYNCNITDCVKGERGKAGELKGVFLRSNPIACVDKNLQCGVYGVINDGCNYDLIEIQTGEAVPGDAQIFSTIKGKEPKYYDISIIKSDLFEQNKNFVIKINDKDLLDVTGGIVQGMSGSPIVQNGKLVGAVTHVFINDPTRGFGIDINKMINN